MGRRQVVRQLVLVQPSRRFESFRPSQLKDSLSRVFFIYFNLLKNIIHYAMLLLARCLYSSTFYNLEVHFSWTDGAIILGNRHCEGV